MAKVVRTLVKMYPCWVVKGQQNVDQAPVWFYTGLPAGTKVRRPGRGAPCLVRAASVGEQKEEVEAQQGCGADGRRSL